MSKIGPNCENMAYSDFFNSEKRGKYIRKYQQKRKTNVNFCMALLTHATHH